MDLVIKGSIKLRSFATGKIIVLRPEDFSWEQIDWPSNLNKQHRLPHLLTEYRLQHNIHTVGDLFYSIEIYNRGTIIEQSMTIDGKETSGRFDVEIGDFTSIPGDIARGKGLGAKVVRNIDENWSNYFSSDDTKLYSVLGEWLRERYNRVSAEEISRQGLEYRVRNVRDLVSRYFLSIQSFGFEDFLYDDAAMKDGDPTLRRQWVRKNRTSSQDVSEGPLVPKIPDQSAGIRFVCSPHGQIQIADSSPFSEDEYENIYVLMTSARENLAAVNLAGTNSFRDLAEAVESFEQTLTSNSLSIDRLYCDGLLLEIVFDDTTTQIAADYLPDLPVGASSKIKSVLQLYGMMMGFSERGRLLLEKAEKNVTTQENQLERDKASRKFESIILDPDTVIIEENTRRIVAKINDNAGKGPNPALSNDLATTTNQNLIIVIAKTAANYLIKRADSVGWGLVSAGIFAADTSGVAASIAVSVDSFVAFLQESSPVIQEFARACGQKMNWVKDFYEWLKTVIDV